MPAGMLLKSDGFASSLSSPERGSTLGDYCAERGLPYHDTEIPVPLETFVDYGLDFQRRFVPDLEPGVAVSISPADGGYRVGLDDGQEIRARRVVMAVGITHYAQMPEVFGDLGPELVTHSSAHHDLSRFEGRDVTVIGAGSSAVDLAVGLADVGAKSRLVARAPQVKFGTGVHEGPRSRWSKVRHPSSGLGPGLRSRLSCDAPDLFRVLPGDLRLKIVRQHLGPSSPWHLRERFEGGVEVLTSRQLVGAEESGGRVRVHLAGGDSTTASVVETDHVICATGYRADLDRLTFVDPALRQSLDALGGAPKLSTAFESSAPGLYFVGISAAATFGPLMRFMYGDEFAARRIVGHLARTAA
jgi:hypothetical protein